MDVERVRAVQRPAGLAVYQRNGCPADRLLTNGPSSHARRAPLPLPDDLEHEGRRVADLHRIHLNHLVEVVLVHAGHGRHLAARRAGHSPRVLVFVRHDAPVQRRHHARPAGERDGPQRLHANSNVEQVGLVGAIRGAVVLVQWRERREALRRPFRGALPRVFSRGAARGLLCGSRRGKVGLLMCVAVPTCRAVPLLLWAAMPAAHGRVVGARRWIDPQHAPAVHAPGKAGALGSRLFDFILAPLALQLLL